MASEQTLIDKMQSALPPVAHLVGFTIPSVEPGEARVELEADERHTNPLGTLHGGILCDIADAAMRDACASLLQPGETFTTLELTIAFLRPASKSQLRALGHAGKRGRTLSFAER